MKRTCALALLTVLVGAAHADQEFKITVTDTGPQPLAPLFFAASTSGFDLFDVGGTASAGITKISEFGDVSAELGIAAASSAVGTYGQAGTGPIGHGAPPANGNVESATFFADTAHPFLSFAAMLGITNDGFIGSSVSSNGLMLFNGGVAQDFTLTILGANAWDAGAAVDAQTAASLSHYGGTPIPLSGTIHTHLGLIPGVGDYNSLGLGQYNWTPTTELATISVQAVPEPMPMAVMGFGLLALVRRRRKGN